MSYFSSLDEGPTVDTVTDPQKLFHALPAKAPKYEYLRDVQGEVLGRWHEVRTQRDTVIKMNTGGGKTVVGLLALKSCLNEGTGSAVYVAPDHYLCGQVLAEAKDLGIETTTDPRSPHFLNGRAILVVPIHTLFNGKSKFGVGAEGARLPIGSLVVDDAHACLSIAEGQFTLTLPSGHVAYDELLKLFRPDIAAQSLTAMTEIQNGDPRAMALVPYWAWKDKQEKVAGILVPYREDKELEWAWPLLKESLEVCRCVFTAYGAEIGPRCLPVEMLPAFVQAKRRIYMTATLADDSVLVTDFDADPKSVAAPISPKGGSDIGERLILVPQEINTSVKDTEIRDFVAAYAKTKNVVVIVPSFERAKFWVSVATATVSADNIEEGVSKLRASAGNLVVMVNKYDGVDLPNDACRMLVVDGLPTARRLLDRQEQTLLEASTRHRAKQVQRIEQGMGRGIRASHDYCVVLLMGSQLLGALYANGSAAMFSSSTTKQLALSRKVARLIEEKGLDEMAKVVDGALGRDPMWVAAAKNALIEVSNPATVTVDPIAIAQREAFDSTRRGRYDRAEAALRSALDKTDSEAAEGWLLQQIAEVVHHVDKVRSQSILAGAHDRNISTTRPLNGIVYPRVDTVGLDQARQAGEYLSKKYADGNAMILGVNALLDRLHFGPGTAEMFEEALKELGLHLGFRAQRPEKLGIAGLDVLWGIGQLRYALLPCKSEAVAATISKNYADQVSGSAAWFAGAYDQTCSAVPVLIHPSQTLDAMAAVPEDTMVLTAAKLEGLKSAVSSYVTAVKGRLDNTVHVRSNLEANNLLGTQIVGQHTLPVKKAT